MKKIILCLMIACLILTGCGAKDEKTVLNEFQDKVEKTDSYYLSGSMELINNEDVYTYKIGVSYQTDDHYKIELTNVINDHEQVILRNEDGVYVVTPSLNKSFKFQSDWPYNNSQVYLLASLLDDISNDSERLFETTDEGYIFTSTVNYPNNESLIKQKVYFGDDFLPKRVEVLDKDGQSQIKMVFDKIDLGTTFNETYFSLDSIMDTNINNENENKITNNQEKTENNKTENTETDTKKTENENNIKNENQEPSNTDTKKENEKTEVKQTATIDDIIYPMYLPVNTYLTKQERVATDNGERLILTFSGDSSFVLVEETAIYSNSPEIIPTYGDVELIGSSLAVINDNSANWFDNGIEYYVVSDTLQTSELLQVVKSISVLPVMK